MRDGHRRRDHSADRRYDDSYRSSKRDRSRDRKRSRDRDVVKDYRNRSRDRDYRDRRDTSRDYDRRRRDVSTDSRRNGRRRDSKDRGSRKDPAKDKVEVGNILHMQDSPLTHYTWLTLSQSPKTTESSGQNDEEKKAERLAKLEAWKQKQKLAAEKQKDIQTAGGTRSLLDEIDRKAAGSPLVPSPSTPDPVNGDTSPTPYAGKFDPKAIVKKATTGSTGVTKLGTDIALPEISKASGPLNSTHTGLKANKSTASAMPISCKLLNPLVLVLSLTNLQLPHRQCL